jgi:hypothetical protein
MEDRILGLEDKVDIIEKSNEDTEKIMKKYTWNMGELWDLNKRPNVQIIGIEEVKDVQAKYIGNIFDKVKAKNL